ncbi:hypothetical protein GRF61_21765 [Azoarcus sp. TTM-91]|uniref:hypothetical protein n=1 Tax=Azoarcus sp. TTM-91 TaxID=2691581 RepID=UPI00145C9DED|nr:hypothetical protein [Azoarcus sp. TTM-91]NMG37088.1 hypothetical protein [Azoarcus sp. TTM-91]
MKKGLIAALLACAALLPAGAHAHGDEHAHEPQHGGQVTEAADLDFELVARPDVISLYIRDHGQPARLAGVSGKLTMLAGGNRSEVSLATLEDRLEARGAFDLAGARVVATVKMSDGKTANVRFKLP